MALTYDSRAFDDDPNERDFTGGATESAIIVGPDLSVTIDDGATTLSPGGTTTYTLTVVNSGTDLAEGVTLSVPLPNGLSFNAASGGGTETTPGVVTYSLPDMAIGATTVVTLTVDVDNPAPAGVVDFDAVVTVTHDDIDPTPLDTTDNDLDTLTAAPDLAITLSLIHI